MNKLIPIEFKNQRIITTKVLADEYGTEEKNIQMNFSRNDKRFIEDKHYYKLEGDALKEFKNSLPTESREPLKFASSLILWTDRGAARHAKILDTDEAWEVYEVLEETYFKAITNIPQSKEIQAIFAIDRKTIEIDNRISKLENTMTIDYSQQEEMRSLATKKVVAILGGKGTPAYKELNKKAFSTMWRDYKRIVDVNSYRNTAIKDLMFARQVIINWEPNRELELMIRGANSQCR